MQHRCSLRSHARRFIRFALDACLLAKRHQKEKTVRLYLLFVADRVYVDRPERHESTGSAVPLNSGPLNEQSRTVFSAPGAADALGETELPGDNPEITKSFMPPRHHEKPRWV